VNDSIQMLRIAITGLACSGKSTGAQYIRDAATRRGLTHETIKLAAPLYAIQQKIYETAGLTLEKDSQDQQLMEAVAASLRRQRPDYLAADFLERLRRSTAQVVVNDDLRDPFVDAKALLSAGFKIIRVTAPPDVRRARLKERADISLADRSTEHIDRIPADAEIVNNSSRTSYRQSLEAAIGEWL
jgi:dephospho-CoA kinase